MSQQPISSQQVPLFIALIPLLLLMGLMVFNVVIFGDSSTAGPNQIGLLIASAVGALLAVKHLGVAYSKIEEGILSAINAAMGSILILLVIGMVIASWIAAGIVPTVIYYGLQLISPSLFLPLSCIACCAISLATGSSWTTTGTLGIALMAIGQTMQIPAPMVAGAVISGAYFGDKMSPLSDTTNLAPSMAGTDLFTHIKHMTYSSGPAIILSILGFSILGFFYKGNAGSNIQMETLSVVLEKQFTIAWYLLLIPAGVLYMVSKRVPALPALLLGTFLGVVATVIFQRQRLSVFIEAHQDNAPISAIYEYVIRLLWQGYAIDSGDAMLDQLLNRGGMAGMLSVVWLILCAMILGGVLESTGMLQALAAAVLKPVKSAGALIGATLASALFTNVVAGDQYIAIVLPGRMFRTSYKAYGLHAKNLSRALEDAGTVTSVLVPWNSGGAYHSSVLGVATVDYLPYCFFNILSPMVSLFLAATGWTIERLDSIDAIDE